MAKNIGDKLAVYTTHANIDAYYGPYTTLDEAKIKVPITVRDIGLTIGVLLFKLNNKGEYVPDEESLTVFENGNLVTKNYEIYKKDLENTSEKPTFVISGITEYQWKGGIEDEDLKIKIREYGITISDVEYSVNESSNTITFTFDVDGNGFLLEGNIYLGDSRIKSIPVNWGENSVTINAPDHPGNYLYYIQVIDKILSNGDSYNVDVTYKDIELIVDKYSSALIVKIPSISNLLDKDINLLVLKIDNITITNVQCYIGSTLYLSNIAVLDNTINIHLSSLSSNYSGLEIKVKVNYVNNSDGLTSFKEYELLLIIGTNVFDVQLLSAIPSIIYLNNNFPIEIYVKAEDEISYNLAIIASPNNLENYSTEFNTNKIWEGSVAAYTLLRIILNIANPGEYYLKFYFNNKNTFDFIERVNIREAQLNFIEHYAETVYPLSNESIINKLICSFILDMDCFIPYDPLPNKLLFSWGNITITPLTINFGGITYPTPLLEKIRLSFMYNVKYVGTLDQNSSSANIIFNALGINGIIQSKSPVINTSNLSKVNGSTEPINSRLTIYKNASALYYDLNNPISAVLNDTLIPETNYISLNPGSQNSLSLPVLSLTTLTDSVYDDIYSQRGIIKGEFGEIGVTKYVSSDKDIINDSNIANYNILLALIEDLKSTLLKKIGVLCSASYSGTRIVDETNDSNIIVEVHTQGTSTLNYVLPNFKFTFLKEFNKDGGGTEWKEVNVKLIPNRNEEGEFYLESLLTAKADYMDSSHLNNTPSTMMYNDMVKANIESKSPSAHNNSLDAIEGIPIILEIDGTNYGSFMLNIDKTGKSLGFEVEEDGNTLSCLSFEGTSNLPDGLASRFIIPDNLRLDFEYINSNINNWDDSDYCTDIVTNKKGQTEYHIITDNSLNSYASNKAKYDKIINVLQYWSCGLEFRYPDSDIIKPSKYTVSTDYKIMDLLNFKKLFRLFYWLATVDDERFRDEFDLYFNFEYCALNFVFLMIFGLTDNMGKNCMWDTWGDNGIWYPRPYDWDSLAGLNNQGKDNIPPFLEIAPEFSLNYDSSYTSSLLELLKLEITSELPYLGENVRRYNFSSSNSKFWIPFYNNFKIEIRAFYRSMRNNSTTPFNSEYVINFCNDFIISKLLITLYNLDFKYKYLENLNSGLLFAYGNRWYKFKDWIRKRFEFCDVYFLYKYYTTNARVGSEDLVFTFPQYFVLRTAQGNITAYYYDGNNAVSFEPSPEGGLSSANYTLYFSPEYLISGNLLNVLNDSTPKIPLNSVTNYSVSSRGLKVVTLSDNTYLDVLTVSNLSSTNDFDVIPIYVKTLNVSKCSQFPEVTNLTELTTLNIDLCNNLILTIGDNPNLKNVNITNSDNLTLIISNQTQFNLTVTNSSFLSVTLSDCNFDILDLEGFSINLLTFSGAGCNIGLVNLRRCKFRSNTLNISSLNANILLLNGVEELYHIIDKEKSYTYLGIENSSIKYWSKTQDELVFDLSLFTNINEIKMVDSDFNKSRFSNGSSILLKKFNSDGYNSVNDCHYFTLKNCSNIEDVINANINNSNINYLFHKCTNLKTVTKSIIKCSGDHMFTDCVRLNSFTFTDSGGSSTTSTIQILDGNAAGMFIACHDLEYSKIRSILTSNTNITNFKRFMLYKCFNGESDTITINLNDYSNAEYLDYAFATLAINNSDDSIKTTENALSNPDLVLKFDGTIPQNCKTLIRTFATTTLSSNTYRHKYKFSNWDNLIKNCTNLEDILYAFAGNNNEYKTISNEWFPSNLNHNNGLSLISTFANSSFTIDSNSFKFPSYISNCASTFRNSSKGSSDTSVIDVYLVFSEITNTKCKSFTYCFAGCSWIKVENGQLVINSKLSNVNILGIFSSTSKSIKFGFNGSYTSDNSGTVYSYTSTETSTGKVGPYYGAKVDIGTDSTITISPPSADKFFLNTTLVGNSNSDIDLSISIGCTSVLRIFENLKLLNTNDKILRLGRVLFNNSTTSLEYAFNGCKVLSSDFEIEYPSNLVNANYMFYNSNFSYIRPLNNLTRLKSINYMFAGSNIERIPVDNSNTYFLPNTITDMKGLFLNCYKLYQGFPIYITEELDELTGTSRSILTGGLISSNNNITNLDSVFENSSILYIKGESSYSNINISLMFPKVTSVKSLFRSIWTLNSNISTGSSKQSFDVDCFLYCTDLDNLFNSTPLGNSLTLNFPNASRMVGAFATQGTSQSVLNNDKTLILSINSDVNNLAGMFAIKLKELNSNYESKITSIYSSLSSIQSLDNKAQSIFCGFQQVEGMSVSLFRDDLSIIDSINLWHS